MLFAIALCYVVMAIGMYRVLSLAVRTPKHIDAIAASLWPLLLLSLGTIFPLCVVAHYWGRRKEKEKAELRVKVSASDD